MKEIARVSVIGAVAAVLIVAAVAASVMVPEDSIFAAESAHAKTGYVSCKSMYKQINKFRKTKKVWQWKKGSKKKQYFNTKKSNRLKGLKRDKALEKTAKRRAKELVKCFDHIRPNGKNWFTIYPKKFHIQGENIACGQTSVKQVMEAWKETDYKYSGQGHRRNMLSKKFKKVGVACYEYKGYRYWVQCFGG